MDADPQSSADGGAMTTMDPIEAWHTDHVYFRRLLALLQRQIEVFHRAERPSYELMHDIVTYLREYGDALHHPREDAAFARLAERLPRLELPIARLRQEHRVISQAGEALLKQLAAIIDDAVVARADVEKAASTYLVYYRSHIAKEEEDVLGQAEKTLTPEDWATVRSAVPGRPDPLFGAMPEERFRELRRQIALESPP
jgi:hemerythrin-like domain-containing protein